MQFFRSLKKVIDLKAGIDAVLLCEVDAYPVRKNWIRNINGEIKKSGKTDLLIAGANYTGAGNLSPDIDSHFNGNSVYFIGSADFYEFLSSWENLLRSTIQTIPYMAYDVVASFVRWHEKSPEIRACFSSNTEKYVQDYYGRSLNLTGSLVNWGGEHENSDKFELDCEEFVVQYPVAQVLHGRCFTGGWKTITDLYYFSKPWGRLMAFFLR